MAGLGGPGGAFGQLQYPTPPLALFPQSTASCVAVAAFGIGPDADAQDGGEAEAEAEALLARHASSPWYEAARPVMDQWTERLLAATDPAEMEQLMATVLPFYLADYGREPGLRAADAGAGGIPPADAAASSTTATSKGENGLLRRSFSTFMIAPVM